MWQPFRDTYEPPGMFSVNSAGDGRYPSMPQIPVEAFVTPPPPTLRASNQRIQHTAVVVGGGDRGASMGPACKEEEDDVVIVESATQPQKDDLPPPSPTVPNKSFRLDCPLCSRVYLDEDSFKRHIMTHACLMCGGFYKHDDLRDHMLDTHTAQRPLACYVCARDFSLLYDLKLHLDADHSPAEKCSVCICEQCGKICLDASVLERHRVTHSHPTACSLCHRRFTHPSNLRRHYVLHFEEKRFECPQCGRHFNRGDNLRTHIKQHCRGNEGTATKGGGAGRSENKRVTM